MAKYTRCPVAPVVKPRTWTLYYLRHEIMTNSGKIRLYIRL